MPRTRRRRSVAPGLILAPLLAFLVLTTGVTGCDPEERVVGPEPGDVKVLFVGSSYFAWNSLPVMFARLSEAGGQDVYIGTYVQSGYFLDYFAVQPVVAELIASEEWDFLLLQGAGATTAYPETHHEIMPGLAYHDVFGALETFQALAAANCTTTVTVFQMPWAFEDGLTWIAGQTDTYFDMQQLAHDQTLAWADSLGLAVAPVGWAFRQVMLDEPPLHYLFESDYNHPSVRGSYLMACVFYGVLYGEPSLGVAFYAGMEREEARALQAAADQVVFDSSAPWYPALSRR
jgi:hypothetical protein